jgi:hypothetical protein
MVRADHHAGLKGAFQAGEMSTRPIARADRRVSGMLCVAVTALRTLSGVYGRHPGLAGPHFRVPRPVIGHGRPVTRPTDGVLALPRPFSRSASRDWPRSSRHASNGRRFALPRPTFVTAGRPVIGEGTSDRMEAASRRRVTIAPHQSPAARPVTPPTSRFDRA